MPRSVRFYCDVLGFEVASHSPIYAVDEGVELFHWALLRRGGAELMLNTAYDEGERPSSPVPERLASHRDTGFFLECPDVDAAYQVLTGKGVICSPPKTAHYGMRQLAFSDPDGYGVVLQWPVEQNGRV